MGALPTPTRLNLLCLLLCASDRDERRPKQQGIALYTSTEGRCVIKYKFECNIGERKQRCLQWFSTPSAHPSLETPFCFEAKKENLCPIIHQIGHVIDTHYVLSAHVGSSTHEKVAALLLLLGTSLLVECLDLLLAQLLVRALCLEGSTLMSIGGAIYVKEGIQLAL